MSTNTLERFVNVTIDSLGPNGGRAYEIYAAIGLALLGLTPKRVRAVGKSFCQLYSYQ